jgi:hypothetical protein
MYGASAVALRGSCVARVGTLAAQRCPTTVLAKRKSHSTFASHRRLTLRMACGRRRIENA